MTSRTPRSARTVATTGAPRSAQLAHSARPGPAGHRRRPLVVTGDEQLLDELLRVAAASGTELDVAADPAAARGRYSAAPLVLVGVDQAAGCLRARLPRRADVVVVAPDQMAPDQVEATAGPDPWGFVEPLGATHVATLPAAAPWLVERLANCQLHDPPARVVAVLSGRGGAGGSVLAAGLAVTAANRGRRVLLVDADPLGGGLDLVLGWEDEHGLRWPGLAGTSGRLDGAALLGALPGRGELAALSFDRRLPAEVTPEAMTAVLDAGRHTRDLVVVDVPRQLHPAAVVALQTADDGLLVVPAEVRAATAAARVAAAAGEHCAQLRLVVRGPSPGRLTAEEISRSLGLPIAGSLRPELGLPAALEGGLAPTETGRGPLAALCRRLVDELSAPAPAAAG